MRLIGKPSVLQVQLNHLLPDVPRKKSSNSFTIDIALSHSNAVNTSLICFAQYFFESQTSSVAILDIVSANLDSIPLRKCLISNKIRFVS